MKPTDLVAAMKALLPTRRPTYIWGPPGIGKSSIIKQAAASLDLPVIDIRAVLLDPVDLRGLPVVKDGRVQWCPPAFFPKGGQGVLFFDELAQAPPLTQAGLLQIILERQCGEYELPEGWLTVAASNRTEDRAGTHRLITPLLNRFIHLDLEVSLDDWQAWALEVGISPKVRSFLKWKPAGLFAFDPSRNERAFATPRSWEFVSDVVEATPEELLHPVVAGIVGEGMAVEFCAFQRLFGSLPDMDQVLANPKTCTMPTQADVLYALTGALVEKCRKATAEKLTAAMHFIIRMPAEFSVLAFRDLSSLHNTLFQMPVASEWLRKNRHVFGS